MKLHPLPDDARRVLQQLGAPPRLVAHLALVHDAAAQLLRSLQARWANLPIEHQAVLFGAATHDVGKILHPAELHGPGSSHEVDGPGLLQRHGIPPELARFARTHATWQHESTVSLEDLFVALADCCWKGQRNETLESSLAARIAEAQGVPQWEAFLALDEMIADIALQAEARLAWQKQAPT